MPVEHEEAIPPGRGRWRGYFRNILAGLAILGVLLFFTPIGIPCHQVWYDWRNQGEFGRHRERYEAIVRAVEKLSGAQGRRTILSIAPDKDSASIRIIDTAREPDLLERGNEVNVIEAIRTGDGRLAVRICTYSLGHAGVYGLYYCSGPPSEGEVENSFGADGRIAPVAPHWWRVSDYSQ